MKTGYASAAIVLGMLLAARTAHAATVNCGAGQTISAAIAKLKPAVGYQAITVKGACTDSLYIPPNLAVQITGASGASLTATSGSPQAAFVDGHLAITSLSISTGVYNGILAGHGGFVTLTAVTITGSGIGLQIVGNAGAQIVNSTINVTGYSAIAVYNGSAEIDGFAPVDGMAGSSLNGGTVGVNCAQGNIVMNANGGNISASNNAQFGVAIGACTLATTVSSGSQLSLSNNGQSGLFAKQGGSAIIAGGVTLTGNGTSAMNAQQNGVISIFNYNTGINTISEAQGNSNILFSCYQGGKIYVPAIANYITPAPTQANIGCLQVGGP